MIDDTPAVGTTVLYNHDGHESEILAYGEGCVSLKILTGPNSGDRPYRIWPLREFRKSFSPKPPPEVIKWALFDPSLVGYNSTGLHTWDGVAWVGHEPGHITGRTVLKWNVTQGTIETVK